MRGGSAAIDTQTSNLLQSARSAKSAGDTLAKPQTHEVPNEKRAPRAFHQTAEGHQTWRESSERHTNVEFASISEICEIRGRYFGEAPNARSAKRKARTASFSPTDRRPPNVAGEQPTTHNRRICLNQPDPRNPREILWRSPKRTKCQTKSEHRELFTNRPKAIKRVVSTANDTQTVGEP